MHDVWNSVNLLIIQKRFKKANLKHLDVGEDYDNEDDISLSERLKSNLQILIYTIKLNLVVNLFLY